MTKGSSRNRNQSKSQRKENLERKRDERSKRNALKKEKNASEYAYDKDGDDFKSFRNQLQIQGFKMLDVIGDGNCLFRALADQLEGDESVHGKHRKETVKYMKDHQEDFAPFVEETVTFEKYLSNLSSPGTYGGNDCIVAFARNNSVDIVIHQLNNPTFIIDGSDLHQTKQKKIIHLAYHDFQHYSSVRKTSDPGGCPAYTYHTEMDLVNNCQETSKTDAIEISKKVSKRNKKTSNSFNDGSDEYISKAVKNIKENCNCQDEELIRKSLVENCYDIDSTVSYVFQLMNLEDNSTSNQCQAGSCINLNDIEISINDNAVQSEEKDSESSCSFNHFEHKVLDSEYLNGQCDRFLDIKSGDLRNNSGVKFSSKCTCNENKDTHENCVFDKKEVTVADNRNGQKKLSNRQRKELAKQARKKRRHESKKDSARTEPEENTENKVIDIKSINI